MINYREGAFSLLLFFLLSLGSLRAANLTEAVRYYERGEFQRAAESLASSSQTSPDNASIHFWLGKSYMKLHKWDDAVRELEMAVQLDPARSDYHLWLGRAYGEKAARASFFTAPSWARKLRTEFETAVKLAPDNVDARFDLLEFYLEAPGIIGGGRDKAEAQVKEIFRINPRLGYTAQARVYEDMKKYGLARAELERAVREFPQQPEAYIDLAEFQLKHGENGSAESSARIALKMHKDLPAANLILASALIMQRKNLAEAEGSLKAMLSGPLRDGEPSFADVYYWLGEASIAQGKRAAARQAFESALRFNPEHERAKSALQKV
jgi:tetratricopeptide (TPR) repeat protein